MTIETFMSLLSPAMLALICWMLRNAFGRYTDRVDALEASDKQTEAKIEALVKRIDDRVSQEEWIRESMRLRNQVEKIGRDVATIDGKLDSSLSVACSINRLAEAIEHTREAGHGEG